MVGLIIYREELDPDHRHAALDIALHPDQHGQGLGCDALRAMARFLFGRGHHRVTIDPARTTRGPSAAASGPGSARSGSCAATSAPPDGQWHDGLLMDLLADDLR